MRVLVLGGGSADEKEWGTKSAEWWSAALGRCNIKNDVLIVDSLRELALDLLTRYEPYDIVVNAMTGGPGEDGTVAGILGASGIPYTGSGVAASSLCMDKFAANAVLRSSGILVPSSTAVTWEAMSYAFNWPAVLKPRRSGSSCRVYFIPKGEETSPTLFSRGEEVVAEDFLPGIELTVPVVCGVAMTPIQAKYTGSIFSAEQKYAAGREVHCPPLVGISTAKRAMEVALAAGKALGCRGHYRVDVRGNEQGDLAVIEVNTNPSVRAESSFFRSVLLSMTEQELVHKLLSAAKTDTGGMAQ